MASQAFKNLFKELSKHPQCDVLPETLDRVAQMYHSFLTSYPKNPQELLGSLYPVHKSTDNQQLITVSDIPFFALCEHHLVPFFGKATLIYLPNEQIFGIGSIHRFIQSLSRQLTLQEKLCAQLSQVLFEHAQPQALLLQLKATHTCSAISQNSAKPLQLKTKNLLGNESCYSLLNQELAHVP